MQNVLADLCVESEAATITAMRLARAYDQSADDERETLFKRLATAVSKYWVCKRGAGARDRGARVPRRQRLRRGVGHAAPLPRGAAQLDLGGLRQRDLPRRAARDGAQPASRSRPSWARSTRAPRPSRGWRRFADSLKAELSDFDERRAPRPADRRADGARAPGLARRALRATRPSPTPSAPRASTATGAARSARSRRRRLRVDHRAPPPEAVAVPSHAAVVRPRGPSTAPIRDPVAIAETGPHLYLANAERQIDPPRAGVRDPHRGRPELVPRALPVHLVADRLLPGRDPGQQRHQRVPARDRDARCSSSSRSCCTSWATRWWRSATGSRSRASTSGCSAGSRG